MSRSLRLTYTLTRRHLTIGRTNGRVYGTAQGDIRDIGDSNTKVRRNIKKDTTDK